VHSGDKIGRLFGGLYHRDEERLRSDFQDLLDQIGFAVGQSNDGMRFVGSDGLELCK